ncbi:hypothetical protein B0H13DRAFT_2090007, partial [Mycena leptocephala]
WENKTPSEDARSSRIRPRPPIECRATISSAIGDALLLLAPTPRQSPPLRKSALGSGSRPPVGTDRSRAPPHQHRKRHGNPTFPDRLQPVLLSCSQLHLYYRASRTLPLASTLIQALQASPVIRCMKQTCTATTRKGRTRSGVCVQTEIIQTRYTRTHPTTHPRWIHR